MRQHLLESWAGLIESPYRNGDRVWVNHPEMDQLVGGTVTGFVMQTDQIMVRVDGTDDLVMVPVAMLKARTAAWDQGFIDSLILTEEDDSADQVRKLIAWKGSTKVGEIQVFGRYYGPRARGKIKWVGVENEYLRRGVATFLFEEAQRRWTDLTISHSEDITDEGRSWMRSLAEYVPYNYGQVEEVPVEEVLEWIDPNISHDMMLNREAHYLWSMINGTGLFEGMGIKEHGILEPLEVIVRSTGEKQIWDGNHRAAAASLAGLDTVPVIFKKSVTGSLSWGGLISIAEQVMERKRLAGRTWQVPEGHRDDPEYQVAMRPLEDFVTQVMGQRTSIYTSEYTLSQAGNPQAMVTAVGSIVVRPVTNDMTILHECAHLIERTREGSGHDESFARTVRDLYSKHISSAAGEAFWDVIEMTGRVEGATNWRVFIHGNEPFWKQHDFTIATQMRGRDRYYTLWVLGELHRNYPRLDDAKGAVESEFGPQGWNQVIMPREQVLHYWFGWTDEFTDPSVIYVADLDMTGAKKMAVTYERVTFDDDGRSKTIYLRDPHEGEMLGVKVLIGVEVNKQGDERASGGADERIHGLDFGLITKRTPMVMDNHYGELTEEGS